MGFKALNIVAAAIAFTLFLLLLLVPGVIFRLFEVPGHESAFLLSRRAAMLFLGMATYCFLGRNAPPSEARQAICLGMTVSMLGLAALGSIELARNSVGFGILLAVATEIGVGLAYLRVWMSNASDGLPTGRP